MGKKVVTVVGATGAQGGSVVRALLQAGDYHVRGITRNPQSTNGKALLALGAEVVQADLNDYASLEKAFSGSHAIYAVTDFFEPFNKHGPEEATKVEVQQGINLATAAAATPTLEHYIWSTLPNARKISNGKHIVPHFEAKNKIDDYIKSNEALLKKTTFFWITFFSQNFRWPVFTPFRVSTAGPDKYLQLQATPSSVQIKSIGDAEINIGIFVQAIVSQPEKTIGKFVLADVEDTTAGELLDTWSKAQSKQAQYIHIDKATYYNIWPVVAEEVDKMMVFWEDAKDKSWSGEEGILTRKDLNVTGLVPAAEAFAKMADWN